MTPEQLKASILQYAIQGKLVEQREEEGTAEELYNTILLEKRNMEKAGVIKKSKKIPAIEDNEIPDDIPESWIWVRLNDIVYNHGQKKPEDIFSYIDIGSIDNIHQKLNDEENLIEPDKAPSRARKIVKFGDIIYSTVRPYLHNMCIIDKEFIKEPIASTGFAVFCCHKGVYNKFLFYYLLSPLFDSYANSAENAKGVAYPAINDNKLYRAVVPLPPLAEQHRIVAKIEELMPFVDRYATSYEKLEQLNAKFPEDMKKSILQYAIQGKLVEQRPEEGTAEELYQQIQEEKQKLIEEGKIKKEKKLAEITEDEIPFDIPESWKWVRIGDIFNVGTGMTPIKSEPKFYQNGNIPWVNSSLTSQRYIKNVDTLITQYALDNTSLKLYPAHTLIIAMYGQGKTRGQISELLIPATTNQACAALESYSYKEYMVKYVYYCFLFYYENLRKKAEGTSQPNLNVKKIKDTIIPFPPYREQMRIVAKIEELLPYCERLQKLPK